MAVGHNKSEECRVWRLNGVMTTGNFDKDLIAPWDEPKEGSVEWANSLPVGTKVRWRTWLSGRYVTRTKCGWTRPQIKGGSLAVPGELFGEREPGWRLYKEPKLRPWNDEEVPVGSVLRHKDEPGIKYLILSASDGKLVVATVNQTVGGCSLQMSDLRDVMANYDHAFAGSNNWLPCGVEEAK